MRRNLGLLAGLLAAALALAAVVFATAIALAAGTKATGFPREFPCTITKAIDGDTFILNIDLGFGLHLDGQRLRLLGVDAFERRTDKGKQAHQFVQQFVGPATLTADGARDSFGRLLGKLSARGADIGAALDAKGYATGKWKQ